MLKIIDHETDNQYKVPQELVQFGRVFFSDEKYRRQYNWTPTLQCEISQNITNGKIFTHWAIEDINGDFENITYSGRFTVIDTDSIPREKVIEAIKKESNIFMTEDYKKFLKVYKESLFHALGISDSELTGGK